MPRPVPAAPGSRFPSGHAPALPIGVFRLANPRLRHPRWAAVPPISPQKDPCQTPRSGVLTHRATVPRLTCATPTLAHWLGLVGCDPPDVVRTVVRRRQFFVGTLQAVSATTTHSLSASSLRPPHVDKPSTSWFHHGHPPVAPRPPLHWPAPDPPDWTAPLFLTNCSANPAGAPELPIRHSFFSLSPSLLVIQPQVAQYRIFLVLSCLPPSRYLLSFAFSSRIHGAGTSLYADSHARQLTSTSARQPALKPWALGAQELGSRSCIPRRDVTPDPASPLPPRAQSLHRLRANPLRDPSSFF